MDASGNTVDDIRYHAFGATRSGGTNTPTDKRFTGQTLDMSTGLYHYGARSYDPVLGRFAQPDTVVPDFRNPQSLNRYSYTINNPLRYTDPTGHYYAPPALTVSPVQAAPPPTGPTSGPAPVPAPTAGPAPALGATPAPARAPQQAPIAVPAPTPSGASPSGQAGIGQQFQDAVSEMIGPLYASVTFGAVNDYLGELVGSMGGKDPRLEENGRIRVYENVEGLPKALAGILGAGAITIGHNIISPGSVPSGSDLYRHERGHVSQSVLLGAAYLPAYGLAWVGALQTAGATHDTNPRTVWNYNLMEWWADSLAGLSHSP